MLSDPKDCMFFTGRQTCGMHSPGHMLQIFSLKLAKIDVDGGPIELYGYLAARDVLDPLLNYVLNVSRNNPIMVEQVCTPILLAIISNSVFINFSNIRPNLPHAFIE